MIPLLSFAGNLFAQAGDQARAALPSPVVQATAILGLENISNNATGELSIQEDALLFRTSEGRTAQIPISSIQDVFFGQEDKQVGGKSMALGRAVAPFGGGRVIGLLAHKKYDFVTLEYRDANGGLHGVICELNKGQAQPFVRELKIKGAHVGDSKVDTAEQRREPTHEVK